MRCCDSHGIGYVLGLAKNPVLKWAARGDIGRAERQFRTAGCRITLRTPVGIIRRRHRWKLCRARHKRHDGSFSYNVLPPTSGAAPTTITTAINVANGSLFTQSPELSAYVDLVLDFSFAGDLEYGAGPFTGGLQHNPININENLTVPLVSINRQKTNSDGTPMTNPDGSPVFDGNINSLAFNLFKAGKDIDEQINKAREKGQQGVIDEAKATAEADVATTPAEKATAESDMTAAEGEVSSGKEEETSTDKESGATFPQTFGELMTVGFAPADGGLLGLEATLSAGFGAGPADIGKPIGNLKLTLPDIA